MVQSNLSAYNKLAAALSPEHPSGAATPPLHALASVPFKWEEQPGKPRPCTNTIVRPEPAKHLELPPCRMTKTSPTTVLDGPYSLTRPRFSSFRLFREKQSSFDSSSGGGSSPQSYVADHDHAVVGKRRNGRLKLFGRSLRVRREEDDGILGFSPYSFAGFDSVAAEGKMAWDGSLSRAKPTPLWATMYESLKHAITWKLTRKSKKGGGR